MNKMQTIERYDDELLLRYRHGDCDVISYDDMKILIEDKNISKEVVTMMLECESKEDSEYILNRIFNKTKGYKMQTKQTEALTEVKVVTTKTGVYTVATKANIDKAVSLLFKADTAEDNILIVKYNKEVIAKITSSAVTIAEDTEVSKSLLIKLEARSIMLAEKEATEAEAEAKKQKAKEVIDNDTKEVIDNDTEADKALKLAADNKKLTKEAYIVHIIDKYFKVLSIAKAENKAITVKEAIAEALNYAEATDNKTVENIVSMIDISLPYFFNYTFYCDAMTIEKVTEAKANKDYKTTVQKITKAVKEATEADTAEAKATAIENYTAAEAEAVKAVKEAEAAAIAEARRKLYSVKAKDILTYFATATKALNLKNKLDTDTAKAEDIFIVAEVKTAKAKAIAEVLSNKKIKIAINTSKEAIDKLSEAVKEAEAEATANILAEATAEAVKAYYTA